MVRFRLEESDEILVTPTGVALAGVLLDRTGLAKRLNESTVPTAEHPDIQNADVVFSYVGLLCQGKTGFEDIEEFRKDPLFYANALGMDTVPSSSTLRQRFDYAGEQWNDIVDSEMIHLLKDIQPELSPCLRNLVPIDIDVSPFDNSKTKKEGVSRTYKGFDGYAPIFAYVGHEGYALHTELREGKQHCQNGTVAFLQECILRAKDITDQPLLVRLDSGNDAKDNLKVCVDEDVDFLIKRNRRHETLDSWSALAKENGDGVEVREGKTEWIGSLMRSVDGLEEPVRIVYKVIERSITADGQTLLIPEVEVESYWTSLSDPEDVVIEQYHDHGTSEQFHSEIKTDMGVERFPSGKFATNSLVLHLTLLAYNILRLVGQESLRVDDGPVRTGVKRRRLRTVIQNFITLASKLVRHARQNVLKFGCQSPWFAAFRRIYFAFLS